MEECPNCGKMLRDRNDVELHFDLHPECQRAWRERRNGEHNDDRRDSQREGICVTRKHTDEEYREC